MFLFTECVLAVNGPFYERPAHLKRAAEVTARLIADLPFWTS